MARPGKTLKEQFPPSLPCSCTVCLAYCARPGWWSVEEARRALGDGYAQRMMLEMAPERTFGVLSPALRGCEGNFALQQFAHSGCTFLKNNLCELYDTGYEPLECRFCHHSRQGQGPKCHAALEKDWHTPAGLALVAQWGEFTGLWARYHILPTHYIFK